MSSVPSRQTSSKEKDPLMNQIASGHGEDLSNLAVFERLQQRKKGKKGPSHNGNVRKQAGKDKEEAYNDRLTFKHDKQSRRKERLARQRAIY